MTKRHDSGVWIAGLSAVVIAGAVTAGLFVAGNPADVRAERIDQATVQRMNQIAMAAQCAFTYTGDVPADPLAIEAALRERRRAVAVCDHVSFAIPPAEAVSYAPLPPDRIELCATFQRPTPAEGQARPDFTVAVPGTEFPELREARGGAGRHCYRVRLVDQSLP
ncbi:MAG: hypothetical protein K2P58_15150 [Hyphomonadaceae bacterium]|nr:hypothetical protein [Hyphomonadaceae bacterium]